MHPTAPFILSTPPHCAFYRTLGGVATAWVTDADAYDAHGLRLSLTRGGLVVTSVEPDELGRLLRRWLGRVDAASQESIASWPLWLLVHAAVERAGSS